MTIPPLYCIADSTALERHGLALDAYADGLLAGGAELVQFRSKGASAAAVLAEAAILREIFAGTSTRLIMNDRADLAVLAGFDGVHVGQGDLPAADAAAVLGRAPHPSSNDDKGWATRLVGVSTHTADEVRAADAGPADYVAIGPVFATGSKVDAAPVVGLEGVRMARGLTAKPLVAIGGITLENCRSVIDAGADSVAVISGLFVPGRTVEQTVRDFLDRLR